MEKTWLEDKRLRCTWHTLLSLLTFNGVVLFSIVNCDSAVNQNWLSSVVNSKISSKSNKHSYFNAQFSWRTIIVESTACILSFLCFSNSSVKCVKFVLFLPVGIVLEASRNFDVTHAVQTHTKKGENEKNDFTKIVKQPTLADLHRF